MEFVSERPVLSTCKISTRVRSRPALSERRLRAAMTASYFPCNSAMFSSYSISTSLSLAFKTFVSRPENNSRSASGKSRVGSEKDPLRANISETEMPSEDIDSTPLSTSPLYITQSISTLSSLNALIVAKSSTASMGTALSLSEKISVISQYPSSFNEIVRETDRSGRPTFRT